MIERIMTVLAREVLDGEVTLPASDVIDRLQELLERSAVGESPRERIVDGLMTASAGDGPIIWVDGAMDSSDEAGRIVDVPVLADGVVLTHRIGAAEISDDRLDVTVDLALLVRLTQAEGGLFLPDGEPLPLQVRARRAVGRGGTAERTGHLVGPSGWLAEFSPGSVVAVQVDHGIVSVEVVDAPDSVPPTEASIDEELAEALRAAMDTVNAGDGNPTDAATLQAMGIVDGWLPTGADTPPFQELIEAVGLESSGDLVGRPGSWEDYADLTRTIQLLAGHGSHLPDDEVKTISKVIDAFRAWDGGEGPNPKAGLADELARAPFALGCLGEELRSITDDGSVIAAFLDAIPASTGRRSSGLAVVKAMALAMQDQTVEAEALIDEVLSQDAHHPGALEVKAWYDSDRGDARSALRRLQRVQELDPDTVAILKARAGDVGPTVGRNDPCPCGSGRKFKQCHLNRTGIDDGVRLSWMMDKARDHVAHLAPYHLLADFTQSPTARTSLESELIATDLALFEGGWLERFLAARGVLLPDEERTLMEGWVDRHHPGAFRVLAKDTEIELLELDETGQDRPASSHTYTLRAAKSFEQVEVGDQVWVRLLPWGDRWATSGLTLHLGSPRMIRALAVAWSEGDWPEAHAIMSGARPVPMEDGRTGHPMVHARAVWSLDESRVGEISELLSADFEPEAGGWTLVSDFGETRWEVTETGVLSASSTTRPAHDAALAHVAARFDQIELMDDIVMPQGQITAFRSDEEMLEALMGNRFDRIDEPSTAWLDDLDLDLDDLDLDPDDPDRDDPPNG